MIKNDNILRVFLVFIRALPILLLPLFFNVKDVGYYGLINSYTILISFILGGELWYEYNRKLTSSKTIKKKGIILSKQINSYLIIYLFIIPIVFFIVFILYSNFSLALLISVLAISTHLITESNRILLHLKKHYEAALASIISNLWITIFVIKEPTLGQLFFLMVISYVTSCIYSYSIIKKDKIILKFKKEKLFKSIKSILVLVKKNKSIFISSILLKIELNSLRLILGFAALNIELGIVSYYMSVFGLVEYFLFYFIHSKFIPKFLEKHSDVSMLSKKLYKINIMMTLILVIGALISSIAIAYLFFDNKEYFYNYKYSFLIAIGYIFLGLSLYYTTMGYVTSNDDVYKKPPIIIFSLVIINFIYAMVANSPSATCIIVLNVLLYMALYFFRWKNYNE
ncbi:hypothetical protein SK500_003156 [Providencia stuartii]|nr:hypothetical protein [Providencia stuartii]EMD5260124.1 hypothetical protein [Providencia stuartii]